MKKYKDMENDVFDIPDATATATAAIATTATATTEEYEDKIVSQ